MKVITQCGLSYVNESGEPVSDQELREHLEGGGKISDFDEYWVLRSQKEPEPAEVGQQIESYLAAGRHENRCKMLLIQDEFILGVLNFHRGEHSFQCLPVGDELPADAIAESVHYDPSYRGFLIRVWSSEFDIVPCGEQIPMFFPMIEGFNMRTMAIVEKPPEYGLSPLESAYKTFCSHDLASLPHFAELGFHGFAFETLAEPQTEHKKESDFFFKGE